MSIIAKIQSSLNLIYNKLKEYLNISISLDNKDYINLFIQFLINKDEKVLFLVRDKNVYKHINHINIDLVEYYDFFAFLYNKKSKKTLSLKLNSFIYLRELKENLIKNGYNLVNFIEKEGDFSIKGDFLYIYPYYSRYAYRLILNLDIIEDIAIIDINTYKTLNKVNILEIPYKRQLDIDTKYKDLYLDNIELLEFESKDLYILQDYIIIIEDYNYFVKYISWKLKDLVFLRQFFTKNFMKLKFFKILNSFYLIDLSDYKSFYLLDTGIYKVFKLGYHNLNLIRDLKKKGYSFFASITKSDFSYNLNSDIFDITDINFLDNKELKYGFISKYDKLVVWGYEYFSKKTKLKAYKEKAGDYKELKQVDLLQELKNTLEREYKIGDLVVHTNYGIGRYLGIVNLKGLQSKYNIDAIKIEYSKGLILYVPVKDMHLIEKYVSVSSKEVKLTNLGGKSWKTAKRKALASAVEYGKKLLKIYAKRAVARGYKFEYNSYLEEAFIKTFPYQESEGQKKAIKEVLQDLSSDNITNRLICADAGFGKTEVALRAAARVVFNSKQVILLAPTTILAYQHYTVFKDRFKEFPVNIALYTRFSKNLKEVEFQIKSGQADIIISTHKLLYKDIEFKNPGLLIIDEEQKFGVRHKEKFKEKYPYIDIIYLTATPIPRTLYLAMTGIMDISIIDTPPYLKIPTKVYIQKFNEDLLLYAIKREVSRKGQVFYVYNDINYIHKLYKDLKDKLKGYKIKILHAKLNNRQIENIMKEFIDKKIDILITTTIVENGLDIPNVNTLIIDKAENFGISNLYQLKGRVGRRQQIQSYAYLFYRSKLSEKAKMRLEAIKKHTILSSSYHLSLEDMNIRGFGGIFSTKQHGNINDVGLFLYNKLVLKFLNSLKNKEEGIIHQEKECKLEYSFDLYIPSDYIPDNRKVYFYNRLLSANSFDKIEDIKREMYNVYGNVPEIVDRIFLLSKIKLVFSKIFFCYKIVIDSRKVEIFSYNKIKLQKEILNKEYKKISIEFNNDKQILVLNKAKMDINQFLSSIIELFYKFF